MAKQLVQKMNQELQRDGWHLEELQLASDDVGYRVSPWNPAYGRAEESLHRAALILSSSWMYQEIQRIESSIDSDPALAIGTAKELIDTCCKHIADRMSISLPANPDTPDLVKAVLKELKLVPEGISDQAKGAEVIKKTLRTLSTTTHGLAETCQARSQTEYPGKRDLHPQPLPVGLAQRGDGQLPGIVIRIERLLLAVLASITWRK